MGNKQMTRERRWKTQGRKMLNKIEKNERGEMEEEIYRGGQREEFTKSEDIGKEKDEQKEKNERGEIEEEIYRGEQRKGFSKVDEQKDFKSGSREGFKKWKERRT